jgi:hypothetical protein
VSKGSRINVNFAVFWRGAGDGVPSLSSSVTAYASASKLACGMRARRVRGLAGHVSPWTSRQDGPWPGVAGRIATCEARKS